MDEVVDRRVEDRLRQPVLADTNEWLAGEDDELARWFEFPRRSTSEDVVRSIERWTASWRVGGPVRCWAICDVATAAIAGGVELCQLDSGDVNLSYFVSRRGVDARGDATPRRALRWHDAERRRWDVPRVPSPARLAETRVASSRNSPDPLSPHDEVQLSDFVHHTPLQSRNELAGAGNGDSILKLERCVVVVEFDLPDDLGWTLGRPGRFGLDDHGIGHPLIAPITTGPRIAHAYRRVR